MAIVATGTVTSFAGVAPPSNAPLIMTVSRTSNPEPAALRTTPVTSPLPLVVISKVASIPSNSPTPAVAVNVVDAV